MAAWTLQKQNVMDKTEVKTVLADLKRKSKRSPNAKVNELIFRLATGCGLRASEIANLRVCDVKLGDQPYIHVKDGKGGKSADVMIPDDSTVLVLEQWLAIHTDNGKIRPSKAPFVRKGKGMEFDRNEIAKRFKTAIKSLGPDRVKELSVHSGRHTAATLLLDRGESLATVRDFMRHSNISGTSVYLHGRELKPQPMFD